MTLEELHALLADAPPPCPHHYALAPDVMRTVLATAQSVNAAELSPLLGVEIREDATLAPGTWEARNRDGSPFTDTDDA